MKRKLTGRQAHTSIRWVMIGYTLVFLGFNLRYLVRNPLPWPDEAVYADIASNYLHEHRLGTNLWQGMIPGVEKLAGWNPPGYFLATAFMFKLFGETLWSQRLLSTIAGLLVGFLLLDSIKQLKPKLPTRYFGFIGIAWLIDYQWMTGSRIARPEMLVLLLGMLTLWLLIRLYQKRKPASGKTSVLIGLVAGSAGLIHPLGLAMMGIGISYWLVMKWFKQSNFSLILFLIGGLLPLGLWLIWSRSDWPLIWSQFKLAATRKFIDTPWIVLIFQSQAVWGKLLYVFEAGILIWMALQTWLHKTNAIGWWLSLTALGLGLVAVWGRMMWYMVFAIPLLYLGVGYWLTTETRKSRMLWLLLTGMALANSQLMFRNLETSSLTPHGYAHFCEAILNMIPDKTHVFLSSAPDAYYCFSEGNRANKLTEFPVLPAPKENYLQLLQNTDYVIFDKVYDSQIFGHLLTDYLTANTESYQPIVVEGTAVTVRIIRLQPNSARFVPTT